MTARQSKPLSTLLAESAAEAPVLAQVRRHSQLQKLFVEALGACDRGDLIASSRVASSSGTTLVIAAANAASAAVLKQMSPRLAEHFRQAASRKSETQGREVTVIRVVLQPDPALWVVAPPPRRRVVYERASMDSATLTKLTERLSDSPLKQTLEKISTRRKQAQNSKK